MKILQIILVFNQNKSMLKNVKTNLSKSEKLKNSKYILDRLLKESSQRIEEHNCVQSKAYI